MALAWADKHFRYGEDQNAEQYKRNETQSRAVLKESLLMAMCIRDMMQGNPKLAEKGLVEESLGYKRHRRRFPGSAPLDRSIPQWRYRRSAAQQLF